MSENGKRPYEIYLRKGMRKRPYDIALGRRQIFAGLVKPMGQQWATIFSRDLLTVAQAHGFSLDKQANNVGLAWSDFQGAQLLQLTSAVISLDQALSAEAAT